MKYGMVIIGLAILCCAMSVSAADVKETDAVQAAAIKALEGLSTYSHKVPYSEAISDMYLGYDAQGVVQRAVVLRKFKTYKEVTAMAVVARKEGSFIIESASIPDVDIITQADKREKVLDAVKDITGRVVKDKGGKSCAIDAVTGATRYYSRIYASFDLMGKMAVEEMERNPAWAKTPLKP